MHKLLIMMLVAFAGLSVFACGTASAAPGELATGLLLAQGEMTGLGAVLVMFLEVFVAFLQAFIFMFLTAVFISLLSHHDEEHERDHKKADPALEPAGG